MKLYTEEDIAKAITFGWELSHYHRNSTEDELLQKQKNFIASLSLTASELPTDEEIETAAHKLSFFSVPKVQFEYGAKWYRETIKKK